jgi:GntR family trehalose operon transcriptional repressor
MPRSKFEAIYRELKDDVESGRVPYSGLMPSENQLIVRFNCSRNTVRRAISMLTEEGYVQPMHGRGVRVIYTKPSTPAAFLIGGIETFSESARRNNLDTTTRLILFTELTADERIEKRTGFPKGTELYYVQRVRLLDGEPCIFDVNLFSKKLVPNLTSEICVTSIYDYIERVLGMQIVMSKRAITVERVTQVDEENLELNGYDCLGVVTGQTFNSEGMMFEYTQSRHRPDYFMFQTTAMRHRGRMNDTSVLDNG